MKFDSNIDIIEIKEIGKCTNCGNETRYYDSSNNEYVCSEKCYAQSRKINTDRLNTVMDSISDLIGRNYDRKIVYGKEVRGGIKFLFDCMMLLPREVKSYFKDKKNG